MHEFDVDEMNKYYEVWGREKTEKEGREEGKKNEKRMEEFDSTESFG